MASVQTRECTEWVDYFDGLGEVTSAVTYHQFDVIGASPEERAVLKTHPNLAGPYRSRKKAHKAKQRLQNEVLKRQRKRRGRMWRATNGVT